MRSKKEIIASLLFETFGYGSIAVTSYLPIYFERTGASRFEIGILMATSPFAMIISAPLLGRAADSVSSRPRVLFFMGLLAALFSCTLYTNPGFVPNLLITFAMFSFIMSSIPIGESMMLKSSSIGENRFSNVRMMGTIGYAAISLLTGYLLARSISFLFVLLLITTISTAISGLNLPNARIEENVIEKSFMRIILKNPILRAFLILSFFLMMAMGYHFSFFPLYANHVFQDERILGYLILTQTLAEIPVLLLFPFLRKRFSMRTLGAIIASGFIIRWFLTVFLFAGPAAFFIQLLHGLGVVPLSLLSMMEINRTIPAQMISRSQTFYWSVQSTGQIIGSVVGGAVVQASSLKTGYLFAGFVSIIGLMAFILAAFVFSRNVKGV